MQSNRYTLQGFQKAAAKFALGLKPLSDRATVGGLYGDLGAGKTTFVQAAAKALGITNHIVSPTFLIMRSYPLSRLPIGGQTTLHFQLFTHIDAYRLESSEELKALRFEEILKDPKGLILIEWADKVADILPKDHLKLHFEFVDPVRDREGSQRASVSNGVDDQTRSISFS